MQFYSICFLLLIIPILPSKRATEVSPLQKVFMKKNHDFQGPKDMSEHACVQYLYK